MSNENNNGNSKLSITLDKREDNSGAIYYVGRLKGPLTIDCKDGVCFLVFTSSEGDEELQIASFNKPKY